ncbi:MAG: carboxypeptidase-like regulatory domain-containing protein [Candidatus Acidiferrales bacterium]
MRVAVRPLALIVACLSIVALPCFGQEPAASANPSDQDNQFCTIAGIIVSANTKEPLKRAQIVISKEEGGSDDHPRSASSDASGHFSIDHIAAGRYDLSVSRTGYLATQYGQDQPDKPGAVLTLVAGQKMTDLLFRLQRTAVIAGRITDEDGEPVRQASALAFLRTTVRGKPRTEQVGGSTTNDLGEYRIFDLPPGSYLILANVTQGNSEIITQDAAPQAAGYPPTYFPGATEIARASAIEVKSGDEVTGIDIALSPRPPNQTYKIHGHVSNSISGHPDASIAVMILPRGQSGEEAMYMRDGNNTRPDEKTGEFEIKGVSPGEYTVLALWFDGGKIRTGSQSLDVIGSDVSDVSIVLTRGIDISGRVTFEGKSAQPSSDTVVVLMPSEKEIPFSPPTEARVQPDGSFVLNEVGDGSYSITVASKCVECYVKSAKANGVDLLEQGVQIGSGNAPSSVGIVYSSNTAIVNGTVTNKDDLPAAGSLVVLVPNLSDHPKRDRYHTATTDQYGRFDIRGVPPGHYQAYAWEKMSGDSYKDPDFLRPFEADAESVDVSENDHTSVQLKLIPAPDSAK